MAAVENAIKDLMSVYNMLEDKQSKDIYLKRLNYLLTGDFQYIRDIVTRYTPHLVPWNGESFASLLAALPEDRDYILYGAGADAATLLEFCKNDSRFIGFCANDRGKQESGYLGYPVMSPEELLDRKNLSVVISTSRAAEEILSLLKDSGYPSEMIFDGTTYYSRFIVDRDQYFNPEFLTFEPEEIFVDVGCYDLGTSLKLKNYCDYVKKVYAFEPDPHNFEVCMRAKNRSNYFQAEIFPYGTWSKKTTLQFNARGNAGSGVCVGSTMAREEGMLQVPVMPIDEVIELDDKVTMIKMDVEGAELESLKGAKRVIQRCKPKLAICIYHKREDLVTIPLYIKKLVPEYKFYIRHHSSSDTDTVLYAVMPQRQEMLESTGTDDMHK